MRALTPGQGAHHLGDFGDMLGGRSATAADSDDAQTEILHRVRGDILGRAIIELPSFERFGISRVRLNDQGKFGDLHRHFDRREHLGRVASAVQPGGKRSAGRGFKNGEEDSEFFGEFLVALRGDEREHIRDIPSAAPNRAERGRRLLGRVDRLEKNKIDASLPKGGHLFGENRGGFGRGVLVPVVGDRSDRTGDQRRRTARCPVGLNRHAPSQGRAAFVNFDGLLGKGVLFESGPIRPERVGGDHVGAGVDIRLMDPADQLRHREVQLVEATVGKDVVPIDFGSHPSVGDQDPFLEGIKFGFPHLPVNLCSLWGLSGITAEQPPTRKLHN